MNLEVRHLRLVAAIAEEGGVTRAAGRLHLTQSALSHQLRDLEGKLGVRLFLRLGRRMVPTPAGERLLASAGSLLEEITRVEDDVSRLGEGRSGVIRLATECYTCYHWVPPVLKDFHRLHARVDVQILAADTRRPVEALLAGRIDLAIASTPLHDPRRVLVTPLFQDEMVAVFSPRHRFASRSLVAPKDFESENVILYCAPEESTLFERVLVPAGVVPRQITQIQLTEAIVEMVKADLGVAVLARWAVARELESGSLRSARVTGRGLRRRWFAARLRDPHAAPYLGDFVDLLARPGMPFAPARPRLVPRRAIAAG
ncbi:MAG TPA: LysR substrate-binding domain-containing protein [Thermoanaerobaculia bacterium]|nr:LysR substrate-binding domain-containing protein [Thermoanaerobaculia bacterium]